MNNESNQGKFESIYSSKVRAGKRRTYFFDVRRTKGDDYYITLTESTKRFNSDGYERHKIFLYKEDFNRFLSSLQDTIDHVKNELMPDYDYDEFSRRQEEWENQNEVHSNSSGPTINQSSDAGATAQEEQGKAIEVANTEDAKPADQNQDTNGEQQEVDEEDMSW